MQDDEKLSLKDWVNLNFGTDNVERVFFLIAFSVAFVFSGALVFSLLFLLSLFVSAFINFVFSYFVSYSCAETVGFFCMYAFLILGTITSLFYLLEVFLSISRLKLKKK